MAQNQQHFLIVTYPAQGHINPALNLAKRLAATTGAKITFSTAVSAHHRIFEDSSDHSDGLITFIPYSDGYDDGFKRDTDDVNDFFPRRKRVGSQTLSSLIQTLNSQGQPITCVLYTILLSWVADVAREYKLPSALYWIQPATVFTIYYHYFHGYDSLISSHGNEPLFPVKLPGLPLLQIRDLPSFLVNTNSEDPYSVVLNGFRETFEALDKEEHPKVLVNSFDEMEPDAFSAVDLEVELIGVGPILPSLNVKDSSGLDLFKTDEKEYMEWLDSKEEKSVVYVSFGSMSLVKKQQMEEILKGLRESGRPYLWVVRKDNRSEGVELDENGENGMVVEWCSQVRVLSHPSVGCFVTHCGWNSTVESLFCGVPTVGVPQWTDQGTNARLAEGVWGTGVRGEINKDGVLEGEELKRCLDLVMGEEERGVEIRRKAEFWKEKAREAVGEGGKSYKNLKAFVEEI